VTKAARIWMTSLLALASVGCEQDARSVPTLSFDRPGTVSFACFDRSMGVFLSLERCDGIDPEDETETRSLTGLVTQSGRGEVAAVDVTRGSVLDSDVQVPGATFVRVEEVPVGIVTLPDRPDLTYVASLSTRRVQALPTARFRQLATSGIDAPAPVTLSGQPVGLEAGPRSANLFAPLPRSGAVARIPVAGDPRLGEPEDIALVAEDPETEPDPVDLTTFGGVPPQADPAAYQKICGGSPVIIEANAFPPRAPVALGDTPRPVAVEVDDAGGRVFLADEHRPLIHVLEVAEDGSVTVGTPINVSVPTRALALTPVVPATFPGGAGAPSAQYLYAIDATDGSVLVVDVLEGSPTYGAVLPVGSVLDDGNEAGQYDRIELPANARSLEVVSPGYVDAAGTVQSEAALCDPTEPGAADAAAAQLRGVFLAAGLTDGTVRYIDVYDLDARCRGGEPTGDEQNDPGPCSPGAPPNPIDSEVYILRHRPRVSLEAAQGTSIEGVPTQSFDGVTGRVEPEGTVTSEGAPGLADLGGCFGAQRQIYPARFDQADGESSLLVCAAVDPWTAVPQRWESRWEGTIPGTGGNRGRFAGVDGEGNGTFIAAGEELCGRGVLGRENVWTSEEIPPDAGEPFVDVVPPELVVPELGYGGDALVVTSELPASAPAGCDRFAGPVDERDEIAFGIERLERITEEGGREVSRLVLGDPLGVAESYTDVERCFRELVSFEVRTRGAYRVAGTRSSFLHRNGLVDQGDGTALCRPLFVDPRLNGRAFAGQRFINPFVSFQIPFVRPGTDEMPPVAVPVGSTSVLNISISSVPRPLAVDLATCSRIDQSRRGVLPGDLRFNPVDERLYAIDTGRRRMCLLGLAPLNIDLTFE
jgi:hypothetical protein